MSKKLLITGINGFVGKNCTNYFQSKGYDVFGIDMFGDVTENIFIGPAMEKNIKSFNQKFDIVMHFAGTGTVGDADKNPELECEKSVNSTCEVLEYIKNNNKDARLIFSSSASVYGNSYSDKISEEMELNPVSIYGKQKLQAENLCEKYHAKYDLDIKIIRFFSLYGIGNKKQLLYDVLTRIKNMNNGDVLPCYGFGDEERDFVNIKDAVNFIDIMLDLKPSFEIYNCASGTKTSVKEVTELLAKNYLHKEIKLDFDKIERKGNPKILIADINKAESIGYLPKVTLEEGIKEYAKWFKSL